MYRALVDGILTKPIKGQLATCPHCGSPMIARCGDNNDDHWAHKSMKECDEWYTGKETEWHINWKKAIGLECSEKKIEKNDTFHIADIYIPPADGIDGLFMEFQNSPISFADVGKRNLFYGQNLIWILNGTDFGDKLIIDRELLSDFFVKWDFLPEYIYNFYPEKPIHYRCAFTIEVLVKKLDDSFSKYLWNLGFRLNDEDFKIVKTNSREDDDHILTFHLPTDRLNRTSVDLWILKFMENSLKEYRRQIETRQLQEVGYQWKYIRSAFSKTNQTIFIDINEKEMLQIENLKLREGIGKLWKKEYFLSRLKSRKEL
jgi:competence protein CoiA-like protein